MATLSSKDQFFAIPELLSQVFRLLDLPSNARNARVCKAWSGLALDEVWKEANAGTFQSLAGLSPPIHDRLRVGCRGFSPLDTLPP